MARYTDASCKLCRREQEKLFLKGERCYSAKCALTHGRKNTPGQHGKTMGKTSEYGLQLREKQKVKRAYGVLEKQFRTYFKIAERKPGQAGENLLILLETRLDNVVYRLGFASSRKEARQLVTHNHYTVNGKKVNIPSFLVKKGDVVAVAAKSKKSPKFQAIAELAAVKSIPQWLTLDKDNLSAVVAEMPTRESIDIPIEEHLIVEFYSR